MANPSEVTLESKIEVTCWVESDETAPPDANIYWRQAVAMEGKSYKYTVRYAYYSSKSRPQSNSSNRSSDPYAPAKNQSTQTRLSSSAQTARSGFTTNV
jgi:hypothetical protein